MLQHTNRTLSQKALQFQRIDPIPFSTTTDHTYFIPIRQAHQSPEPQIKVSIFLYTTTSPSNPSSQTTTSQSPTLLPTSSNLFLHIPSSTKTLPKSPLTQWLAWYVFLRNLPEFWCNPVLIDYCSRSYILDLLFHCMALIKMSNAKVASSTLAGTILFLLSPLLNERNGEEPFFWLETAVLRDRGETRILA